MNLDPDGARFRAVVRWHEQYGGVSTVSGMFGRFDVVGNIGLAVLVAKVGLPSRSHRAESLLMTTGASDEVLHVILTPTQSLMRSSTSEVD